MGQAFVSFEGDVSLLFMVLVWRLAGELNQVISQKLVEVIWKGKGFFVIGFLFNFIFNLSSTFNVNTGVGGMRLVFYFYSLIGKAEWPF